MSSDWLRVVHVLYDSGQRPTSEEVFDWLLDYGVHTEETGGNELCYYYAEGMDYPKSDMPTEQALTELRDKQGFIEFWLDNINLYFQNWDDYPGVPDLPYYTFKIPEAQLTPVETVKEGATKANKIVNLVADFADETGATYGFGDRAAGERESERQDMAALQDGELDRIFWFNYFSAAIVSKIGREQILSAPAERVEERANGAVLLLPYLNPRHQESGHDPREVAEHLES